MFILESLNQQMYISVNSVNIKKIVHLKRKEILTILGTIVHKHGL